MLQSQIPAIVNMIKKGSAHEKANAERILKKYCIEKKLDYNSVLNGRTQGGDPDPFRWYGKSAANHSYYKTRSWENDDMRRSRESNERARAHEASQRNGDWDWFEDAMNQYQQSQGSGSTYSNTHNTLIFNDIYGNQWDISEVMNLTNQRQVKLFGKIIWANPQ